MSGDNKVIQGLWIGRAITRLEQLSIKSFLAHGHDYHLYTYGQVANVPAGAAVRDANEILPERDIFQYQTGPGRGSYAGFANRFRYKLLLDKGGWWADLDMVCLKPFDFAAAHVFASQNRKEGVCVNNCCMKAPAGSALMRSCYDEASAKDSSKLAWGETGPFLLDREVRRLGLEGAIEPPNIFCPVDFREFRSLMTESGVVLGEACYAVHLWNEMWRRKSREGGRFGWLSKVVNRFRYRGDRRFSGQTVMGQLQRRYAVE